MQEKPLKNRFIAIFKLLSKEYILLSICTFLVLLALIIDLFTSVNYFLTIVLILTCFLVGILLNKKISVIFASVMIVIYCSAIFSLLMVNQDLFDNSDLASIMYRIGGGAWGLWGLLLFPPFIIIGGSTFLGACIQVIIFYSTTPKEEIEEKHVKKICPNCLSVNSKESTNCKKCGKKFQSVQTNSKNDSFNL
ncbi:MAG: hypothetical protein HGN29_02210 [Asgard group archaeon]|nr:hypothetical protein [Asgard group archaeon]